MHLHNSFTLSHLYVSAQITILFVLFVKTLGFEESSLAQCKRMASLPSVSRSPHLAGPGTKCAVNHRPSPRLQGTRIQEKVLSAPGLIYSLNAWLAPPVLRWETQAQNCEGSSSFWVGS